MPSPLRTIGYWTGGLTALVLVVLFFRGPEGWPAIQSKWDEVKALDLENDDLRRANQARREKIKRLRTSQEEMDLLIREQLNKGKAGEMIFKIPERKKPSESTTTTP